MTRSVYAFAAAAALLLAGCGSDRSDPLPADGPKLSVTELAPGVHAVSSGDPANPSTGTYYAAADGARLLVLNKDDQQASALLRRAANGPWQATPAMGASLEINHSNPIPPEALQPGALAGSYAVRLPGGAMAAFTLNGNGDLAAGDSACKLSGKLSASSLPGVLAVTLSASGCGALPARSSGFAVRDADYAPAVLRLLTYTDSALVDLWVYAH